MSPDVAWDIYGLHNLSLVDGLRASTRATSVSLDSRRTGFEWHSDNASIARRGTVSNSPTARSPEVSRSRSLSASSATPAPAQAARKRTSSGVFQVEESEPPSKKTEVVKENTEGRNNSAVVSNGRRKHSESEKETEKERKKEKDVVIKSFASDRPVECVTAFKESDSWD